MVAETRRASKARLSITEADIQAQLYLEYLDSPLSPPPSHLTSPDQDSDVSMGSPTFSDDSSSDSDVDYLSDASTTTRNSTPRLVEAIEHELGLTRLQGNRLRDSMQTLMREGNLLGNLNFKTNKAECREVLQPIFVRVLSELDFEVGAGLSEKRVGELLLDRAKVVNRNEVHNRYMVTTGRVKRRVHGTVYGPGEEEAAIEEQQVYAGTEDGVQEIVEDEGVEQVAEPNELAQQQEDEQGSKGHDVTMDESDIQQAAEPEETSTAPPVIETIATPRGSVVAAHLQHLSLDGARAQSEEAEAAPGSPMQLEAKAPQPKPKALHDREQNQRGPAALMLTPFYPTSFIIRVAGSTLGAAVHISELVDPAQTAVLTAEGVGFHRFIQVASEKLGFNVQGRICAALPYFLKFLPEDSLVLLDGEATWRAVLQAWQNSRRRLCEFVVERNNIQE